MPIITAVVVILVLVGLATLALWASRGGPAHPRSRRTVGDDPTIAWRGDIGGSGGGAF